MCYVSRTEPFAFIGRAEKGEDRDMEESVVKSCKLNLKKKFRLAWMVMAVLFVLVAAVSFVKYARYKSAQGAAVELTLATTNQFNAYQDNYRELIEEIYDFLNPAPVDLRGIGIDFDNSEVRAAARDADRSLGKLLEGLGYDCYYGSDYLRYVGFLDYTRNHSLLPYIAWAVLALVLLLIHLWYAADAKKEMVIQGDRVLCRQGTKTVKEFLVKDVKSVAFAPQKGLVVFGNGIKYRINLLQNAEELKTALMDAIAAAPAEPAALAGGARQAADRMGAAAELKKYKELLDQGVITQEEYDGKKRQLLEL